MLEINVLSKILVICLMLHSQWITYWVLGYLYCWSTGCCGIGVIRAALGTPEDRSECLLSIQSGASCRTEDRECCNCCKLGQII